MMEKTFGEFKFEDLSQVYINITFVLVVLSIIGIVSFVMNDKWVMAIVSVVNLCLNAFIFGPLCWSFAYNKRRSEGFAYLVGFLFGVVGTLLYWLYTLMFENREKDDYGF